MKDGFHAINSDLHVITTRVTIGLLPMPVHGHNFNVPEYDGLLWQEITRLGMPLAFHGTGGGAWKDYVSNLFRHHANFRTLNHACV